MPLLMMDICCWSDTKLYCRKARHNKKGESDDMSTLPILSIEYDVTISSLRR